jgi:hypothetical protein
MSAANPVLVNSEAAEAQFALPARKQLTYRMAKGNGHL